MVGNGNAPRSWLNVCNSWMQRAFLWSIRRASNNQGLAANHADKAVSRISTAPFGLGRSFVKREFAQYSRFAGHNPDIPESSSLDQAHTVPTVEPRVRLGRRPRSAGKIGPAIGCLAAA